MNTSDTTPRLCKKYKVEIGSECGAELGDADTRCPGCGAAIILIEEGIYDPIPPPRPVTDELSDGSSPTIPPRQEIRRNRQRSSQEPCRHTYETHMPTFTVKFHVAAGKAYKLNPDTDKVFLCLGSKQRKMQLDRILSNKLCTFKCELEIDRRDMLRLQKIPYGYEIHRFEAGKSRMDKETLKSKELAPFRFLEIQATKVPFIDTWYQYDGILHNCHQTIKSQVHHVMKPFTKSKIQSEVIKVVTSWLPRWDSIMDGEKELAETFLQKIDRLMLCFELSFLINGKRGIDKEFISQVMTDYVTQHVQFLKMHLTSNLYSATTDHSKYNPRVATLAECSDGVPWSDMNANLLDVIKSSCESDDLAVTRMSVAISMVYIIEKYEVSLHHVAEMRVIMCAILCKHGIKHPRPDFEAISIQFPNLNKDLLMSLQFVMKGLATINECYWVLGIPLYLYYMESAQNLNPNDEPLNRPWGADDLIDIIYSFNKASELSHQQYCEFKSCFEPLYKQCSLLKRTQLMVLSLERLSIDNIKDFNIEDILCQIHWRAKKQDPKDKWEDKDSVRVKYEVLGNVMKLLLAQVECDEASVINDETDIEKRKQLFHRLSSYAEICVHIISIFVPDTACYNNIGIMLDFIGGLHHIILRIMDNHQKRAQELPSNSKDAVKLLASVQRGQYLKTQTLEALANAMKTLAERVLPQHSEEETSYHSERLKILYMFLEYTNTVGQQVVHLLIREHFEKLNIKIRMEIHCLDRLPESVSRIFAMSIVNSLLDQPQVEVCGELCSLAAMKQDPGLTGKASKAQVLLSALIHEKLAQSVKLGVLDSLTWPYLTHYVNAYKAKILTKDANQDIRSLTKSLEQIILSPDEQAIQHIAVYLRHRSLLSDIMQYFYGKDSNEINEVFAYYEHTQFERSTSPLSFNDIL